MDRWCSERQIAKGAVVPLEQVWILARSWYSNRLDSGWQPRTPGEMQQLFAAAGLTGDFWHL